MSSERGELGEHQKKLLDALVPKSENIEEAPGSGPLSPELDDSVVPTPPGAAAEVRSRVEDTEPPELDEEDRIYESPK